jgi:hypothetical protein
MGMDKYGVVDENLKNCRVNVTNCTADEITVVDDKDLQADLLEQLTQEYDCQTPSELTLVNIASVNYTHYFKILQQINSCEISLQALYYGHHNCGPDGYHPVNSINGCKRSQFELLRLGILSKEADRVFRHYLNAINTLRRMKQLPIQINIKTQTAVFGQNQVVQANNRG